MTMPPGSPRQRSVAVLFALQLLEQWFRLQLRSRFEVAGVPSARHATTSWWGCNIRVFPTRT
eukprot:6292079-Heterocapsa_arctica.AAC.1